MPTDPQRYDHPTILALNEHAGDYTAHYHALFAPVGVMAVPSFAYRLALAAPRDVDAAVSLTPGLGSHDIAGGHAQLMAVGGALVWVDGRPVVHSADGLNGSIGGRPEIVAEVQAQGPSIGQRVPRNGVIVKHRVVVAATLGRAQGALLELLAVDALGSQVEFLDPAAIRQSHPGGLNALLRGGTWNLLEGQHADDGETAFVRSLVDAGCFNRDRVAAAYVACGASKPFDMGGTTRAGLDALQ